VPTAIMARICLALADPDLNKGDGLSKNGIEGAVKGKAQVIRYALELLISKGHVAVEQHGQAKMHKLVRPFPDD
jgi:hypothetical protein